MSGKKKVHHNKCRHPAQNCPTRAVRLPHVNGRVVHNAVFVEVHAVSRGHEVALPRALPKFGEGYLRAQNFPQHSATSPRASGQVEEVDSFVGLLKVSDARRLRRGPTCPGSRCLPCPRGTPVRSPTTYELARSWPGRRRPPVAKNWRKKVAPGSYPLVVRPTSPQQWRFPTRSEIQIGRWRMPSLFHLLEPWDRRDP